MNSWVSHIEQEELINIGKCLDARQKACDEFCQLLTTEYARIGEFDRDHAKAPTENKHFG